MRKDSVSSRDLRLLPITAGLLMAFAHAPGAQAQNDGRRAIPFQRHQEEAGADFLAGMRSPSRPSLLPQEPASRDCRTIVVRNCNDRGSGSLRDAVARAVSGDTIDLGQLHCSAITLTSGAIDVPVDDLTIMGSRHHALRIDGNHADRVLNDTGYGTLTISDLTLTHGRSVTTSSYNGGGCLLAAGGAVTLKRVQIVGCEVVAEDIAHGGGVYAYGPVIVSDSAIIANTVRGGNRSTGGGYFGRSVGGGIFSYTNAVFTNTLLIGNAAKLDSNVGGGIAVGGAAFASDIELTDSEVSANSATSTTTYAGASTEAHAAGLVALGTLTMTRSAVSDNAAQAINTAADAVAYSYAFSYGAGMRATTFMIVDSTVSGNSTSAVASNPLGIGVEGSRGAGFTTLSAGNTPVVNVVNSTISGNTSSRSQAALYPYGFASGGGIFGNGGTLDVQNSTIAFNTAESGGGIFQYMTSGANAESTIVANNISLAVGGSDFDVGYAMNLTGANDLIMSSSPDLTLPGGTLSADPKLVPLADNGGPTRTHALRSSSPAINSGNNVAGLRFDQRGNGFPRKVGPATDIGAFEKR